jgi:hypothetical protein
MNDREKWSEFVDNISKCFGENDHYEIIEWRYIETNS